MNKNITLAVTLAGLLAVAAIPSYSDHVQITINLVSGTEDECADSITCVGMTAVTLDAGGEVIWSNDGSKTISLMSGEAGDHHAGDVFGPISLESGQTYSRIFDEAGEVQFHIVDHPWMTGIITVVSDEDHVHDGGHMHNAIEAEEPMAVAIDVVIEDEGGINVHVMTQGWIWSPENVNLEHTPGEGHAHTYVDGVKSRVYAPYYHIPGLEAGSHHIRVALSANTHGEMHVNGFPVEAVVTVLVPEPSDHDEPTPVDGTASMSVEAVAHVDAKSGYNLEVNATDFVISGAGVDGEHVDGEGYAVITVDGEYHNRLYGNWLQLPDLEPGEHTVVVSLFANDHRPYHWDGQPIETSVVVVVPDADDHTH